MPHNSTSRRSIKNQRLSLLLSTVLVVCCETPVRWMKLMDWVKKKRKNVALLTERSTGRLWKNRLFKTFQRELSWLPSGWLFPCLSSCSSTSSTSIGHFRTDPCTHDCWFHCQRIPVSMAIRRRCQRKNSPWQRGFERKTGFFSPKHKIDDK